MRGLEKTVLVAALTVILAVRALPGGNLQVIAKRGAEVWDIYAGCASGGVMVRHNGIVNTHPGAWARRIAREECENQIRSRH